MTKSDAETSTLTRRPAVTASATSARARSVALIALVGATAVWGSTFVVTKLLLDQTAPFFIVAA